MKKGLLILMCLLFACSKPLQLKTEEINSMPLRVYVFVEDYSNQTFTITISNQSGYEMECSDSFILQKKVNGKWKTISKQDASIHQTLQDLDEMKVEWTVNETLDSGKYKIINGENEVEFELK